MNQRVARYFVFIASFSLLAAFALDWLRTPRISPRRIPLASGAVFWAERPALSEAPPARWSEPSAQTAGREWIFEVFTPPLIDFDPDRGQFAVRPPLEPEPPPVFGLSVTGIERVPYRLQYAGHHGVPGHYLVEIHDVDTDVYFRGEVGNDFPDGGFMLKRFSADARRVSSPDRPWATPYVETSVEIELRDHYLDQVITIGSEPEMLPDPVVRVVADESESSALLAVGESIESADSCFTIESIDEISQEVSIAKHDLSGAFIERQRFTLKPTLVTSDH